MKKKFIWGFTTFAISTTPFATVVACSQTTNGTSLSSDFKSMLTNQQKVNAFRNIITMRRILDSGLQIAQDGTVSYKKLATRDDSGKKTEVATDLTAAIKNGIYEFDIETSKGNFYNEGARIIAPVAGEAKFFTHMLAHAINIYLNDDDKLMVDAGLTLESKTIAKYLGQKYLAKNKKLKNVAQEFLNAFKKHKGSGDSVASKVNSKAINNIATKFFEVNGGVQYLVGFGYYFTIGAWWPNVDFVSSLKGIKFLQAFLSKRGIKAGDNILTKAYPKLKLNDYDLERGVEPTQGQVKLAGQPLLPGTGKNWQEMAFTYENNIAKPRTLTSGWYFQVAKEGATLSPTVSIIKAPVYQYTPPNEGDAITIANFAWKPGTIEIAISGLSNGVKDGTYKNTKVTKSGYDNSYEMHFKRVGSPAEEPTLLIFLPHFKEAITSRIPAPEGTRIFLAKAPWNIFWFLAPATKMKPATANKILYEFLVKADGSIAGAIFKYVDIIGAKLSFSLKK